MVVLVLVFWLQSFTMTPFKSVLLMGTRPERVFLHREDTQGELSVKRKTAWRRGS